MTSVSVILLDGHGTLTYPIRDRLTIYQQLCQQHGVQCSREKIREHISDMKKEHYLFLTTTMKRDGCINWMDDKKKWFSLEAEIFYRMGLKGDYYKISWDLLTNFMNPQQQCIFTDVVKFLKEAKKRNYALGIVSNSDSRYRNVLEYHKILKYFDCCIVSSEVHYKKPGKQIFYEACNFFSTTFSSCAYIGDQYLLDVKAGLDAGISHSYLIKRDEIPEKTECTTLSSLSDVFTHIT